jgi:hypothetical protein
LCGLALRTFHPQPAAVPAAQQKRGRQTLISMRASSPFAVSVALLLCGPAAVAHAQQCPDKLLPGVGIGGGGTVTALKNTTTQAACCALCHGDYHDECSGWVYNGPDHPAAAWLQAHNCAIMATNGPPRPVAGHVTGLVKGAAPAPAPPAAGKACNADINCAPTTAALWRCKAAQDAAGITPENNCHIPGPGSKGNASCACSVQTCANTSSTPAKPSAAVQYLVIGDSISMGMNSDLSKLVAADGWALTHNPGNAASSNLGAHCLAHWVQEAARKWDVISFQFGLHDLGYDTERISVEQCV